MLKLLSSCKYLVTLLSFSMFDVVHFITPIVIYHSRSESVVCCSGFADDLCKYLKLGAVLFAEEVFTEAAVPD